MIVLIRSNSIVGDPRVEKYINFLQLEGIKYKVIGWNRCGEDLNIENVIFFNKKCGYAIGGIKAVYNRLLWFLFVIKKIFSLKNVTVIHGCDLDSAFPAALYKFFGHRKVKVVFDVFDWFSATLANQSRWICMAFQILEKFAIRFADMVIICEEERCEQIPYDISNKMIILPNIPDIIDYSFKKKEEKMQFRNGKITVSYVGGFYDDRFLNELLDLASNGSINLQIAGYGDKRLEDKCKIIAKQENVHYYGKVLYNQGLQIMYNSDVIYAMYCKSNPNHLYAAPNKFYEAMLLSKPIISTQGTLVGNKIEKMDIGYVIEENIKELEELMSNLSLTELQNRGKIAFGFWEKLYKSYVLFFMKEKYLPLLNHTDTLKR